MLISDMHTQLIALLVAYEQQHIITHQERLTVERRFALNGEEKNQRTYAAMAHELQISKSRSQQVFNKAMRRLRRQPAFVEALNAYLPLAPYPHKVHPRWMDEQGLLSSDRFPTRIVACEQCK
jgi:hypothetical protein